MRLILLWIFIFVAGCSKPDPNPELKDGIYQDLNTQLSEVTRAVAEEEKKLAEHEKALKEVVPQTGQIKYAQKRVFESQEKITKLKQQKQWLELHISERKAIAKKSYLKAFKNKEEWPDPKEYEQYKAEKRLRDAKLNWDVKKRIQEASAPPEKPGGEKKGH